MSDTCVHLYFADMIQYSRHFFTEIAAIITKSVVVQAGRGQTTVLLKSRIWHWRSIWISNSMVSLSGLLCGENSER